MLVARGYPVWGCVLDGLRFDTGTPLGFIEANVGLALSQPKYSGAVREMLVRMLGGFEL